jgi:hypothetical protein
VFVVNGENASGVRRFVEGGDVDVLHSGRDLKGSDIGALESFAFNKMNKRGRSKLNGADLLIAGEAGLGKSGDAIFLAIGGD